MSNQMREALEAAGFKESPEGKRKIAKERAERRAAAAKAKAEEEAAMKAAHDRRLALAALAQRQQADAEKLDKARVGIAAMTKKSSVS